MSLLKRNGSSFPRLLLNDFFDPSALDIPHLFDWDRNFSKLGFLVQVPSVNITENDNEFKMQLAAPGLEKKDFKIELQDDRLTVSAQKEKQADEEKENYHRREFSYQSFSRSFQLPENAQADKIDAHYQDGILLLTIPKAENGQPEVKKEIEVL